jgi:hypothetical protein
VQLTQHRKHINRIGKVPPIFPVKIFTAGEVVKARLVQAAAFPPKAKNIERILESKR